MAKVVITLTAVLMAFHYTDALPTVGLTELMAPFATEEQTIQLVDTKCLNAVKEVTKKCNQTTQASWKNEYDEMIEAEKEGDKEKYSHLNLELACCESWDMIPCTEDSIKDKCSSEDYQKIWVLLEWTKQQLEQQYCQAYPFEQRAVKCKH